MKSSWTEEILLGRDTKGTRGYYFPKGGGGILLCLTVLTYCTALNEPQGDTEVFKGDLIYMDYFIRVKVVLYVSGGRRQLDTNT